MTSAKMTLVAIACSISGPTLAQGVVTQALEGALPKGWECLQGPNELDRPGRTFYIDRDGVCFELQDLSERLKRVSGAVSSIAARADGYASAGLLAKLLRFTGALSISGARTYATAVALFERQELRTDEGDARAALRTLDPKLIERGNTYYIIRNVQLARQMRLTVDRSVAGAFGGEAAFGKLSQASGAATPPANPAPGSLPNAPSPTSQASGPAILYQDNNSYTIDQTFDKPLTVCFLAQKFTLQTVTGGVAGDIVDAELVEEYWNPSTEK
jgi:hypothetical protein